MDGKDLVTAAAPLALRLLRNRAFLLKLAAVLAALLAAAGLTLPAELRDSVIDVITLVAGGLAE